jgi:hypothetical protein
VKNASIVRSADAAYADPSSNKICADECASHPKNKKESGASSFEERARFVVTLLG